MPEWLHKELVKLANKKGLKGKEKDAYVYGTLDKYEKASEKTHKKALKKALKMQEVIKCLPSCK